MARRARARAASVGLPCESMSEASPAARANQAKNASLPFRDGRPSLFAAYRSAVPSRSMSAASE